MYRNKPIIGLAGGIGSGKSYVAQLFQQCGCFVVDSDALARAAFDDPKVIATLRSWWGDAILTCGGTPNRKAVATLVFNSPKERERLESLLHPLINAARESAMAAADESIVKAFVWDTPLLFETGLDAECDAVVFVDAPDAQRLERVRTTRGWSAAELHRREKLQWSLDKKQEMSDYSISNTAGAGETPSAVQTLRHVQEILQRVLVTGANAG